MALTTEELEFAQSIKAQLIELQLRTDTEEVHGIADDLLVELLNELGLEDVTSEYTQIHKWYA